MSVTPNGSSAFMMALINAGGDAIAPASPHPFTPRSLWVQAVTVLATLKEGKLSAAHDPYMRPSRVARFHHNMHFP